MGCCVSSDTEETERQVMHLYQQRYVSFALSDRRQGSDLLYPLPEQLKWLVRATGRGGHSGFLSRKRLEAIPVETLFTTVVVSRSDDGGLSAEALPHIPPPPPPQHRSEDVTTGGGVGDGGLKFLGRHSKSNNNAGAQTAAEEARWGRHESGETPEDKRARRGNSSTRTASRTKQSKRQRNIKRVRSVQPLMAPGDVVELFVMCPPSVAAEKLGLTGRMVKMLTADPCLLPAEAPIRGHSSSASGAATTASASFSPSSSLTHHSKNKYQKHSSTSMGGGGGGGGGGGPSVSSSFSTTPQHMNSFNNATAPTSTANGKQTTAASAAADENQQPQGAVDPSSMALGMRQTSFSFSSTTLRQQLNATVTPETAAANATNSATVVVKASSAVACKSNNNSNAATLFAQPDQQVSLMASGGGVPSAAATAPSSPNNNNPPNGTCTKVRSSNNSDALMPMAMGVRGTATLLSKPQLAMLEAQERERERILMLMKSNDALATAMPATVNAPPSGVVVDSTSAATMGGKSAANMATMRPPPRIEMPTDVSPKKTAVEEAVVAMDDDEDDDDAGEQASGSAPLPPPPQQQQQQTQRNVFVVPAGGVTHTNRNSANANAHYHGAAAAPSAIVIQNNNRQQYVTSGGSASSSMRALVLSSTTTTTTTTFSAGGTMGGGESENTVINSDAAPRAMLLRSPQPQYFDYDGCFLMPPDSLAYNNNNAATTSYMTSSSPLLQPPPSLPSDTTTAASPSSLAAASSLFVDICTPRQLLLSLVSDPTEPPAAAVTHNNNNDNGFGGEGGLSSSSPPPPPSVTTAAAAAVSTTIEPAVLGMVDAIVASSAAHSTLALIDLDHRERHAEETAHRRRAVVANNMTTSKMTHQQTTMATSLASPSSLSSPSPSPHLLPSHNVFSAKTPTVDALMCHLKPQLAAFLCEANPSTSSTPMPAASGNNNGGGAMAAGPMGAGGANNLYHTNNGGDPNSTNGGAMANASASASYGNANTSGPYAPNHQHSNGGSGPQQQQPFSAGSNAAAVNGTALMHQHLIQQVQCRARMQSLRFKNALMSQQNDDERGEEDMSGKGGKNKKAKKKTSNNKQKDSSGANNTKGGGRRDPLLSGMIAAVMKIEADAAEAEMAGAENCKQNSVGGDNTVESLSNKRSLLLRKAQKDREEQQQLQQLLLGSIAHPLTATRLINVPMVLDIRAEMADSLLTLIQAARRERRSGKGGGIMRVRQNPKSEFFNPNAATVQRASLTLSAGASSPVSRSPSSSASPLRRRRNKALLSAFVFNVRSTSEEGLARSFLEGLPLIMTPSAAAAAAADDDTLPLTFPPLLTNAAPATAATTRGGVGKDVGNTAMLTPSPLRTTTTIVLNPLTTRRRLRYQGELCAAPRLLWVSPFLMLNNLLCALDRLTALNAFEGSEREKEKKGGGGGGGGGHANNNRTNHNNNDKDLASARRVLEAFTNPSTATSLTPLARSFYAALVQNAATGKRAADNAANNDGMEPFVVSPFAIARNVASVSPPPEAADGDQMMLNSCNDDDESACTDAALAASPLAFLVDYPLCQLPVTLANDSIKRGGIIGKGGSGPPPPAPNNNSNNAQFIGGGYYGSGGDFNGALPVGVRRGRDIPIPPQQSLSAPADNKNPLLSTVPPALLPSAQADSASNTTTAAAAATGPATSIHHHRHLYPYVTDDDYNTPVAVRPELPYTIADLITEHGLLMLKKATVVVPPIPEPLTASSSSRRMRRSRREQRQQGVGLKGVGGVVKASSISFSSSSSSPSSVSDRDSGEAFEGEAFDKLVEEDGEAILPYLAAPEELLAHRRFVTGTAFVSNPYPTHSHHHCHCHCHRFSADTCVSSNCCAPPSSAVIGGGGGGGPRASSSVSVSSPSVSAPASPMFSSPLCCATSSSIYLPSSPPAPPPPSLRLPSTVEVLPSAISPFVCVVRAVVTGAAFAPSAFYDSVSDDDDRSSSSSGGDEDSGCEGGEGAENGVHADRSSSTSSISGSDENNDDDGDNKQKDDDDDDDARVGAGAFNIDKIKKKRAGTPPLKKKQRKCDDDDFGSGGNGSEDEDGGDAQEATKKGEGGTLPLALFAVTSAVSGLNDTTNSAATAHTATFGNGGGAVGIESSTTNKTFAGSPAAPPAPAGVTNGLGTSSSTATYNNSSGGGGGSAPHRTIVASLSATAHPQRDLVLLPSSSSIAATPTMESAAVGGGEVKKKLSSPLNTTTTSVRLRAGGGGGGEGEITIVTMPNGNNNPNANDDDAEHENFLYLQQQQQQAAAAAASTIRPITLINSVTNDPPVRPLLTCPSDDWGGLKIHFRQRYKYRAPYAHYEALHRYEKQQRIKTRAREIIDIWRAEEKAMAANARWEEGGQDDQGQAANTQQNPRFQPPLVPPSPAAFSRVASNANSNAAAAAPTSAMAMVVMPKSVMKRSTSFRNKSFLDEDEEISPTIVNHHKSKNSMLVGGISARPTSAQHPNSNRTNNQHATINLPAITNLNSADDSISLSRIQQQQQHHRAPLPFRSASPSLRRMLIGRGANLLSPITVIDQQFSSSTETFGGGGNWGSGKRGFSRLQRSGSAVAGGEASFISNNVFGGGEALKRAKSADAAGIRIEAARRRSSGGRTFKATNNHDYDNGGANNRFLLTPSALALIDDRYSQSMIPKDTLYVLDMPPACLKGFVGRSDLRHPSTVIRKEGRPHVSPAIIVDAMTQLHANVSRDPFPVAIDGVDPALVVRTSPSTPSPVEMLRTLGGALGVASPSPSPPLYSPPFLNRASSPPAATTTMVAAASASVAAESTLLNFYQQQDGGGTAASQQQQQQQANNPLALLSSNGPNNQALAMLTATGSGSSKSLKAKTEKHRHYRQHHHGNNSSSNRRLINSNSRSSSSGRDSSSGGGAGGRATGERKKNFSLSSSSRSSDYTDQDNDEDDAEAVLNDDGAFYDGVDEDGWSSSDVDDYFEDVGERAKDARFKLKNQRQQQRRLRRGIGGGGGDNAGDYDDDADEFADNDEDHAEKRPAATDTAPCSDWRDGGGGRGSLVARFDPSEAFGAFMMSGGNDKEEEGVKDSAAENKKKGKKKWYAFLLGGGSSKNNSKPRDSTKKGDDSAKNSNNKKRNTNNNNASNNISGAKGQNSSPLVVLPPPSLTYSISRRLERIRQLQNAIRSGGNGGGAGDRSQKQQQLSQRNGIGSNNNNASSNSKSYSSASPSPANKNSQRRGRHNRDDDEDFSDEDDDDDDGYYDHKSRSPRPSAANPNNNDNKKNANSKNGKLSTTNGPVTNAGQSGGGGRFRLVNHCGAPWTSLWENNINTPQEASALLLQQQLLLQNGPLGVGNKGGCGGIALLNTPTGVTAAALQAIAQYNSNSNGEQKGQTKNMSAAERKQQQRRSPQRSPQPQGAHNNGNIAPSLAHQNLIAQQQQQQQLPLVPIAVLLSKAQRTVDKVLARKVSLCLPRRLKEGLGASSARYLFSSTSTPPTSASPSFVAFSSDNQQQRQRHPSFASSYRSQFSSYRSQGAMVMMRMNALQVHQRRASALSSSPPSTVSAMTRPSPPPPTTSTAAGGREVAGGERASGTNPLLAPSKAAATKSAAVRAPPPPPLLHHKDPYGGGGGEQRTTAAFGLDTITTSPPPPPDLAPLDIVPTSYLLAHSAAVESAVTEAHGSSWTTERREAILRRQVPVYRLQFFDGSYHHSVPLMCALGLEAGWWGTVHKHTEAMEAAKAEAARRARFDALQQLQHRTMNNTTNVGSNGNKAGLDQHHQQRSSPPPPPPPTQPINTNNNNTHVIAMEGLAAHEDEKFRLGDSVLVLTASGQYRGRVTFVWETEGAVISSFIVPHTDERYRQHQLMSMLSMNGENNNPHHQTAVVSSGGNLSPFAGNPLGHTPTATAMLLNNDNSNNNSGNHLNNSGNSGTSGFEFPHHRQQQQNANGFNNTYNSSSVSGFSGAGGAVVGSLVPFSSSSSDPTSGVAVAAGGAQYHHQHYHQQYAASSTPHPLNYYYYNVQSDLGDFFSFIPHCDLVWLGGIAELL